MDIEVGVADGAEGQRRGESEPHQDADHRNARSFSASADSPVV